MVSKRTASERVLYSFFVIVFSVWLISLLAIYLPASNWVTSTFPPTIDNTTLAIFLASTVLSSLTSFLLGLDKLVRINHTKKQPQEK